MLSTFLTSGNLIDFLGHKGVSIVNNSISYLDASIKFETKGTSIEEFIQNVTLMQQKHRSSGLKLTSSGDKIFDKQTNTINLKLGFNTVQEILKSDNVGLILKSDNVGLILKAVLDFFSFAHPILKKYFESLKSILQKGKRSHDETTDEKILSFFKFLLELCIPEIDWYIEPFEIWDDTDENPVNFFEFQFLETGALWWKREGQCDCDTCGGKKRQRFFLTDMGDKKISNLEVILTDEVYDNYFRVLQKRCKYFENLNCTIEETKGSVSELKTLAGLYNIETNLYTNLYSNASTNNDQVDFEHYKKEYFFRQYRKYCM
jgi:hypothetical protein